MKLRLLFVLLLTCSLSFAQTAVLTETASPESEGVSSTALAQIDEHIKAYIADGKVPGGAFLIAKGGKVIYEKQFGYRTSKQETQYAGDDIYRIASMTKAITCVAVMQLWEQKKIGLLLVICYHCY